METARCLLSGPHNPPHSLFHRFSLLMVFANLIELQLVPVYFHYLSKQGPKCLVPWGNSPSCLNCLLNHHSLAGCQTQEGVFRKLQSWGSQQHSRREQWRMKWDPSHNPRLHVGSNLLSNSTAWGTFTELSRIELSRIELSRIEQCRHRTAYQESSRKFYMYCQEFWGVS